MTAFDDLVLAWIVGGAIEADLRSWQEYPGTNEDEARRQRQREERKLLISQYKTSCDLRRSLAAVSMVGWAALFAAHLIGTDFLSGRRVESFDSIVSGGTAS